MARVPYGKGETNQRRVNQSQYYGLYSRLYPCPPHVKVSLQDLLLYMETMLGLGLYYSCTRRLTCHASLFFQVYVGGKGFLPAMLASEKALLVHFP